MDYNLTRVNGERRRGRRDESGRRRGTCLCVDQGEMANESCPNDDLHKEKRREGIRRRDGKTQS